MTAPIKLITRSEQQTAAQIVEKLRKVIQEIETGDLKGAVMVAMVFEIELDEDHCRYPIRTSGMTNSQALWLLEHGKRVLLND